MSQDCPNLRIFGPADGPVAQRTALLLALRGQSPSWQFRVSRNRLVVTTAKGVLHIVEDGAAMLELIEELHPDQPLHPTQPQQRARHREIIALAFNAQAEFMGVTRAINLRDLDIAVYKLRETLATIDAALGQAPLRVMSNADAALLPVLWRAALLDRRCQAHLLDGFPALIAYLRDRLSDERVRRIFGRGAAIRYLAALQAGRAVVAHDDVREDWTALIDDSKCRARLVPLSENAVGLR
ncbi:glutathione S-transferase family protein [Paracoccus laeviglucosivorans]|uniref:Glutathione S-transferase n=1 Tax=Paracoccus laeviglucosivorans TaxID=1197861 RepID=A0A521BSK5_9RHOB|nr:glutathione S-transferase family protein [Paracoccus laeviglucosivorans]SMO50134.1 Glutathione S-transferase [Paracoccus laeviglucosivorans]